MSPLGCRACKLIGNYRSLHATLFLVKLSLCRGLHCVVAEGLHISLPFFGVAGYGEHLTLQSHCRLLT